MDRFRIETDPIPIAEGQVSENVHNLYLQLGAETGIVGLSAFLTIFGFILWRYVRYISALCWKNEEAGTVGNSAKVIPFEALVAEREGKEERRAPSVGVIAGLIRAIKTPGLTGFSASLAIFGLGVYSLTQHPTLRFEFHVLFWMLAGLVHANLPIEKQLTIKRNPFLGILTMLVLTAFFQAFFFPHPSPVGFEYRFHQEDGYVWLTERVAFIREPLVSSRFFLPGRKATGSEVETLPPVKVQEIDFKLNLKLLSPIRDRIQTGYIELNGNRSGFKVGRGAYDLIEADLTGRSRLEFGTVSEMALPGTFPDSWGYGVRISHATSDSPASKAGDK
jgi:hypothetical protein